MENQVFMMAISVVVIIGVLLLGARVFVFLQDFSCSIMGVEKVLIDIKEGIRIITPQSLLDKKTYQTLSWCTDKIIFVDRRVNKSFLNEYPAIKNSVEDGSKNNVFLMKGKKIKSAFESGSIETPYPYFLCVKPRGGKLNLMMEGKGNRTRVTADCADDCTPIVVTANVDKIRTEASAIDENVGDATDKIELKRKFCRFNESFTKVEVTIKAKGNLNNVKYIEYLPKECIDDLNKYLESIVIPPYYKIKADPLIMWHFNSVDQGKEEKIIYVLKIELSDYCKELISGMGIVSERNTGPYLFDGFDDMTLFVGDSLTLNLDEHFKDSDNNVLIYDAIGYDSNYVSAYTDGNEGKVTAGINPTPETEVSFRATDQTNLQTTGTMKVMILDSNVCYDPDSDGYGECPACGTSKGCLYDGDDCSDDPSIYPGSCSAVTWSGCDITAVGGCDVGTCTRSLPQSCLPRCDDRIQNGDETGIDCGGSCIAPACSLTQGVCAGSKKKCTASGWADCTAADYGADYQATETNCDTKDNDCDGQVDEGCICTSGATQSCGDALCSATQTCSGGAWGNCVTPSPLPTCEQQTCGSDYYALSGDTCYKYSYFGCTKQCSSSGTCNECTCASPIPMPYKTPSNECRFIDNCNGPVSTTTPQEKNKDDGTSCSTNQACASGTCITPELEATATPTTRSGINYYFNLIVRETHGLSVTFDNVDRKFLVTGDILPDSIDWIKGKCGGTNIFSECVMNDRLFGTSVPDTYQEIWYGSINGIQISTSSYTISTNQYS